MLLNPLGILHLRRLFCPSQFYHPSNATGFLVQKFSPKMFYSQNTNSVPLPLLCYVVIFLYFVLFCTLFCSVARSDLLANIATFVFEMIIFNKGIVFRFISMIKGAKYIFYRVQSVSNTEKCNKVQ